MKDICVILLCCITFIFSCQYKEEKVLGDDFELFKNTPIYDLAIAVKEQDSSEIYSLIKKGKNINYKEKKRGQSLLIIAVKNNLYKSVKFLINNNADIHIHDSYDGTSAVIEASKMGKNFDRNFEILKLLLENGANPNDIESGNRREDNHSRLTPLIVASKCCLEKVKLLLEYGAEINHKNEYNQSALYSALNGYKGKEIIVKYLLDNGADYNQIFRVTDRGNKIKIENKLRDWTFKLNSPEYKVKMDIINFLKKKGINYFDTPIPKKYQKKYPESYLKKY